MSDAASIDVLNSTAQNQLKTIVERIERLEEEKAGVAGDIKEVYAEAKGNGFDAKTIRRVVRYRKEDAAKRQEAEAIFDLYLSAIEGMPPLVRRAGAQLDVPAPLQKRVEKYLRDIVPEGCASLTIEGGGARVTLSRDAAGDVTVGV